MQIGRRWRVLAGAGAAALILAGCGGQSDPALPSATSAAPSAGGAATSGTATSAGAAATLAGSAAEISAYVQAQRAWVACMGQHGVDLPDPDRYGVVDLKGFRHNDPQARTAYVACQSKLVAMPDSVQQIVRPPLTAAQKEIKRKYATCMQSHGAPDFPDPGPDGYYQNRTWDQTSSGAARAAKSCASIIGEPTATGVGVG